MTELSRRETLAAALALAAAAPLAVQAQTPPDAELPTLWDLTVLYPSDAAWTAEKEAVEADLPRIAAFRGRLGESPAVLLQALETISALLKRTYRLSVYATLKADEDLQVAENQARRQLATALFARFGETAAFVDPELLTVGAEKIEGFLAAEPGLAKFRFSLMNTLRRAPHTLSPESEAILAAAVQPLSGAQEARSQLVLSDMPWPTLQLARGEVRIDSQGYVATRSSPDREERKKVFEAFYATFKDYESTLGANLATQVNGDVFMARSRKYDRAVEAALAGDNIPVGVYETLVSEANNGLPVLQRYFELRRKMLGLPDMAYHDIYPPVTRLDREFTLAESRRLTLEAVRPLGAEYVAELTRGTAAAWTHVYPQKGKRAGAYVHGAAYDVHPFMLLNHTDDYEGLSTYAHEWGHAMHSLLANKAQPFETANYATFIAEVASTLNELLLVDMMVERARSKPEKLFYLDRLCELIRGTFYRQTMFGEFELAIHTAAEKGEALTGEKLTAMYLELVRRYHGPKVAIPDLYGLEWAYIQHFYYNFYVYQYATCVVAANDFADKIRRGGARARDTYLDVLKAGGSDYPVEILKRGGVDMTTPAPYRALIARFERTITEMEKLI